MLPLLILSERARSESASPSSDTINPSSNRSYQVRAYYAIVSLAAREVNPFLGMEQRSQGNDTRNVYVHRHLLVCSYIPLNKGSDHTTLSPTSRGERMGAGEALSLLAIRF